MLNNNTICAIATAPGGAIGIIRISGSEAISIADRIFRPIGSSLSLSERKAYTLAFGNIVNSDGDVVDEVLVSIFRAPHSYTGEDSVEISCHGSAYVLQQVMLLLTENGCVPAGPGEFTQRAFLNGKMDLSQAEAVADLISSTNKATHDMAMSQLKGHFSNELADLRAHLLKLTSLLELELDFSDHEELEFADRTELKTLAEEIHCRLDNLTHSFQAGNAIKKGIAVALIGETNVGKSTLLNALVGEERAIVSDIAGTTRDTIEDTLVLDGILYRFIDTAGLRETQDEIERLGIARSRQAAEEAQIVIEIQGAPQPSRSPSLCREGRGGSCGSYIRVVNKADLLPAVPTTSEDIENTEAPIYISAKNKQIAPLLARLKAIGCQLTATRNAATISNIRHYEALTRADEAIQRVQEGLAAGVSGEFLSMDLHDSLNALGEVTGQITSNEVLHSIFSHFCIGK